jgi:hypothetical protein
VLSGTSAAMMGSIKVTTLHPRGPGGPMLPLAPEVVLSSPEDSLRWVHREGDPLWTIPTNMAPESQPWGRYLGGQSDLR